MTDSKTSTKSNTQNAQPQKVPHFSAAAVKRAKNAKASARLLEAMKFIKLRRLLPDVSGFTI